MIARVFYFLPLAFIDAIARSANQELAELALRRQWLQVMVGQEFDDYHHAIGADEFCEMVLKGTPPAYRIALLRLSLRPRASVLLETPGWVAWVQKYAKSVAIDTNPGCAFWADVKPHLSELPVVDIYFADIFEGQENVQTHMLDFEYPNTLELLTIRLWDLDVTFRDLVLPPSLKKLMLEFLSGILLEELPVLPRGLRVLEFSNLSGMDISDDVALFPQGLEKLRGMGQHLHFHGTDPQHLLISESALQYFSPLMKHDCVVYRDGTAALEVPAVEMGQLWFDGSYNGYSWLPMVDASRLDKLSALVSLPFNKLMFASTGAHAGSLEGLNDLIGHLEELTLFFLPSLEGLVVPEHVRVTLCTSVSLLSEASEIVNVTDLMLLYDGVPLVPPRLAQMEFVRTLVLRFKASEKLVVVPALPNVEDIVITVDKGGTFPDLRLFARVVRLRLYYVDPTSTVTPRLFPSSTEEICIEQAIERDVNFAWTLARAWGDDPRRDNDSDEEDEDDALLAEDSLGLQIQSLRHLLKLSLFRATDVPRLDLSQSEFPDSIRNISCHIRNRIRFDSTAFPSGLESIRFNTLSLQHTVGTVSFPDSLSRLSLNGTGALECAKNNLPSRLTRLDIGEYSRREGVGVFPFRPQWASFDVSNPWTVCRPWLRWVPGWVSRWVPRWLYRWVPLWLWSVPTVYPQSLEHLSVVAGNMVPPPPEFSFPQSLRFLYLNQCEITDITPYRFPPSVEELGLRENDFPIVEEYEWPQVKRLYIKSDDDPVTAEEQELLERKIPGVAINPEIWD